jgi:hypothetical protein
MVSAWTSVSRHRRMASFTALLCGFPLLLLGPTTSRAQNAVELRAPSAFSNIVKTQPRSRALFTEAAKVIMNPRSMNCHPASDSPTQGNDMHPHLPPATRAEPAEAAYPATGATHAI